MTVVHRRPNRAVITVAFRPHSGVLHGPVRVVHPTLRALGCPWQYDHRKHAFLVPVQRLDAVIVIVDIEARGHVIVGGRR
jgi:hypothetical protein